MTFNLRLPNRKDGPNYWDSRRELVAAAIREKDPDLIGTQELVRVQAQYLGEKLPLHSWFGASRTGDENDEHTGVFYRRGRFAPVESGDFWLSETPDEPGSMSWGMHIPRTVTWGLFEERRAGRRLCLFNTHFPHRPEDAGARVKCAELIASRIASLPGGTPVVLTGDFNCEAGEEPYQVLAGLLEDAWVRAERRSGPAGTFNNFAGIEGPRMDWILYRGLKPVEAETITRNEEGRYPSDHYPVFARFEFEEAA